MMLFFTILFFTWYVVGLAKGTLFYSMKKATGEEEIRKQKLGMDNYKPDEGFAIKMLLFTLFLIPFTIGIIVYLCVAVQLDPLKLPTLGLLGYFLISLLSGFIKEKKKIDLSTEDKITKYRNKLERKRTFKGTALQLLWVIYFGYMACNLVL